MKLFFAGKMQKIATNLLIASLFLVSTVNALDVPPLAARVNDHAGMLSPATVELLDRELAALELRDSTQIAVLTITTLEGEPIETFGIRVGEAWKLGQRGIDNGAILIIAKSERKIRIEVGRGLEGKLTDLIASQIIRNEMAPHFKTNDFDGGVQAGVMALSKVVAGEYKAKTASPRIRASHRGPAPFTLLLAVGVACLFAGSISKILGGIAGAVGLPVAISFVMPGFSLLALLGFALAGFAGGLVLPILFGHGGGYNGPFWWGGGGFGGGSGGGDGGFSGGGGDFGGGGASGDW